MRTSLMRAAGVAAAGSGGPVLPEARALHAPARELPARQQAVGGEPVVERRGRTAVEVGQELARDRAEVPEVEPRVLGAHRVEGPGDEPEAARERRVALGPLEPKAEALPAPGGAHREHVGVQVRGAVAPRCEAVAEADDPLGGRLGHEQKASRVNGGDQLDRRGDLEVAQTPDLALQQDARVEVGAAARGADLERGGHRSGSLAPARRVAAHVECRPATDENHERKITNDHIPLPGLSKDVWNATLYYENYGFGARIATRYRSEYIGEVTNFANERGFRYVDADMITDAQVSYTFGESGMLDGLQLPVPGQQPDERAVHRLLGEQVALAGLPGVRDAVPARGQLQVLIVPARNH